MRYFILDDVIGIVKTLENIIESRKLGEVVGYETDPERAAQGIIALVPDIVLIDLLMSKKDGITIVGEIKRQKPDIRFVMISRVSDKEMVAQAYRAGVEFFIHKPINVIEVETVLKKVMDTMKMKHLFCELQGLINHVGPEKAVPEQEEDPLKEIKVLLNLLGMLGEKGTKDLLAISSYLIEQGASYSKKAFESVCDQLDDSPKNVDQRVRRAVKKGLTNVAHLGLEDYSNDIFQNYAGYVFDFKNIKDEMDHIRGLNEYGGRVNLSKFIDGLLAYKELEN